MKDEKQEDIYDMMPFIALIHNISKNKIKYSKENIPEFNIFPSGRYLMKIYDFENLSQDDLANLYGQSKGTVAKSLKKLEDEGYIEREADPENRRKYILKTTQKGNELVPRVRKLLKEWEDEVGISDLDDETKEKIKEIARKSAKLIND